MDSEEEKRRQHNKNVIIYEKKKYMQKLKDASLAIKPTKSIYQNTSEITGLSGWFIVFLLGVIVLIFYGFVEVIKYFAGSSNSDTHSSGRDYTFANYPN